jgi:hypothetical protein
MSLIVDCQQDLLDQISVLPGVRNKIFSIFSEEDLLDKSRGVKLPCAGVFYSGITSQGLPGGGLGTEAVFVVAIVLEAKTVGNLNTQTSALELLDGIRAVLKHRRSPSGHHWRFFSETAGGQMGNAVVYTQTWRCVVVLTN